MDQGFHEAVAQLVREVLPETLDKLEMQLSSPEATPSSVRAWALELPQKGQREALSKFAKCWNERQIVLTRDAAIAVIASHRFIEERRTQAEICWSGPTDTLQGFRTTSAAYNEMMASALSTVLLLTFSIGEVESLRTSLEAAIQRGVSVRIILEDFDVFTQESRREKIQHFGAFVLKHAQIFIWPVGNRRTYEGRVFGSMHVKGIVIDAQALLLTSANWSGAAMQDNMELGVVLRDRELPGRLLDHFDRLIVSGLLVRLE